MGTGDMCHVVRSSLEEYIAVGVSRLSIYFSTYIGNQDNELIGEQLRLYQY